MEGADELASGRKLASSQNRQMIWKKAHRMTAPPNWIGASRGLRPSILRISADTTVKNGSNSAEADIAPIRPALILVRLAS